MKLSITYHGRLTELVKKQQETLTISIGTASMLRKVLIEEHPELQEITFQLAQENKIINGEDRISEKNVDLFPPFSGG